ncbi:TnpA family transposase [Nocardiopsis arvandica]|uniref:TnpA family transposase n=1 Tax=Nocardiopsis sinuspersici TaxID=501010 RepID=A0A7Y9XIK6_9ACTN|nr:TnpA family transposase [Nocardiopsis sinuspersici]
MEDRLVLLEEILPVLAGEGVPPERVGVLLRERIGMERLKTAHGIKRERLPRDHGHLAALKESYAYLRGCVPGVLKAVRFDGNEQARDLLKGLEVLRELNETGKRKVPEDAPNSFVPSRWRNYLNQAAHDKDSAAFRRYWELSAIVALRDGLRSGNVHVPASRRYADPASYLMPKEAWADKRTEFCAEVGTPREATEALAQADDELHTALAGLELVLDRGEGPARLSDDGRLIVPKLEADDVPAEAESLRTDLAGMLPRLPLAALLIEVDRRTGLSEHLVHAGGKQSRGPQVRRNLLAVVLAHGLNMGLTAMAEATGISYDELAWTSEWYLREETLRAAIAAVVNYHHRLPMTRVWGAGTLSSSDGQRFPMQGKSLTARHLSRYFVDAGISQYTHVSDQHSTYGTKVIVPTHREAHYVLDEILGNQTDLPITEHATDTHGVTLVNFALFDLVGLTLSPRIRDLGRIVLHRLGPRGDYTGRYPMAGPLLTGHINTELITTHWDDMLRLAASFKYGHSTASLLVGKLSASSRQNALAAALKEWGALRRTIYACRYLTDEQYQRRIARQLNKGESLHGLRRDLHHVGGGAMRRRHHEQQSEQALCLTLLTNAIICWTTEYFGLAVAELRASGRYVDDAVLAHISSARSEGVNLIGEISIDVDKELSKLDEAGYRPLRRLEGKDQVLWGPPA